LISFTALVPNVCVSVPKMASADRSALFAADTVDEAPPAVKTG
jgi:hypothetical protein